MSKSKIYIVECKGEKFAQKMQDDIFINFRLACTLETEMCTCLKEQRYFKCEGLSSKNDTISYREESLSKLQI